MTQPAPSTTALVGRDAELAALEHALRSTERGVPVVLVTGPPGVGSTALVTAATAGWDAPVLRARGARWESARPFGVVRQLLPDAPDDPFAAAESLAALAPAPSSTSTGTTGAAGASRTVIVVDDAQWSDPESLQAFSTLAQHHPAAALAVVMIAAPSAAGAPPETLDLLRRLPTTVVRLDPFDAGTVAAVAAARGIPMSLAAAERLQRHTTGLVRHVLDLLAELPPETWSGPIGPLPAPTAVAAAVRHDLGGCSPATRAVVEALAVLGSAPLRDVVALAGVDDPLAAIDEAHRRDLVRAPSPGSRADVIALQGPLVAAAVLGAMGSHAAAVAHRRAAEVVSDEASRLRHLVAAAVGQDDVLAARLDAAATEQAASGAWAAAAELLLDAGRLSVARPNRDDRLIRAVDALVGAGDTTAAAALLPEVESLRETPLRDAVLGYLAIVRGRAAEAERRLQRAWDLVNLDRDPGVGALVAQRFVLHSLARCRGGDIVAWADRTIELAGPQTPAGIEAEAIRGLGLAFAGRPGQAAAHYEDLAARVRHGAQAQRVTMGHGWLELALDDVEGARADLERAVPTAFLGGSRRISLWALAWLARTRVATGDWDGALDAVRQGKDLVARTGLVLIAPLLHWTTAQVSALRGDWERAAQAVRDAESAGQEYQMMRIPTAIARAQVAEAQADYAGVLSALHPLTQPWAREAVDEPGLWPWADVYANALVLEGRLDEADTFLQPYEEVAALRGHRSSGARLGLARGRWHGARGDLTAARGSFTRSLAMLERLPLRYDRARVMFAFGQTLRRAGKRREADAVMSTARDIFLTLGATTYVHRCERELRAAGVAVTRGEREVDALTPQEVTVCDLVASGKSNREAAAELHLSEKTVQYHLTRIYAKLGIRSRAELVALRSTLQRRS